MAINLDVFAAERIIIQLIAQTHVMSLQNLSSVSEITWPTIKAAQFTKIFNFGKDSTQQVILCMLILVLNLQIYKVAHPSNQNPSSKPPVQTQTYAQATSNKPIYNTIPLILRLMFLILIKYQVF